MPVLGVHRGSSGTDTFTFRAFDGHRYSNAATVSVTIEPTIFCAVDVTSSLSITLGGSRLDRKTGHFFQKVTLKNSSGSPITGPVSFVLDSLSTGTVLVGAAGVTSCATPSGSPYVVVDVGSDGVLTNRERSNVSLEFILEFTGAAPSYVTRVLAGSQRR